MNEIDIPQVPSRETIERLQAQMVKMPQAYGLKTEHAIHGGLYYRKLFRLAGTIIVGKVHKIDHLFICVSGEIRAWSETGMRTLRAGDVIESKAGTKRVTLALTDAVGMTVHPVKATTIEDVELEIVEPDETATFDFNNLPKDGVLMMQEPPKLGD